MSGHRSRYEGIWKDCTEVLYTHVPEGRPIPHDDDVSLPVTVGMSTEELVDVDGPRVLGMPVYADVGLLQAIPRVVVRSRVRELLIQAAAGLPNGFGISVADGWRPLDLQAELYEEAYADSTLSPGFVSVPDPRPAFVPPHNTGGTVDCTLTYDGVALALGTHFDAFTEDARVDAFENYPGTVRTLRRLLYWTMVETGFVSLPKEWWHYEYGTRRWSVIRREPVLYGPATPACW
ncbi:MAG: M15 family metallopeptidase [Candidatus Dormibacteria bacterium]